MREDTNTLKMFLSLVSGRLTTGVLAFSIVIEPLDQSVEGLILAPELIQHLTQLLTPFPSGS